MKYKAAEMAAKHAESQMGTLREAVLRHNLTEGKYTWESAPEDTASTFPALIETGQITPYCTGGSLHVSEYRFMWEGRAYRSLFGLDDGINWREAEFEVGVPVKFESRGGGGFFIKHPSEAMTLDERAEQMWRVHPADLDRLGYVTGSIHEAPGPRERFYLDHLKAAVEQQKGA